MANVKATDLITFTRASAGHALRKVSYGSELVVNGGFDTDSDWIKSAGTTISGGKATTTVTSGGYEYIYQLRSYNVSKIYKITLTVNGTAGSQIRIRDNTSNTGGLTIATSTVTLTGADQEVSLVFIPTSSSNGVFIERNSSGNYSFTVDNVSVKEVTFDQPDGTLQLFEHPDNIPRIEYDASGNVLGLLIEESRTNLITQSEDISGLNQATADDDVAVAPDGTQTADKLIESTSNSVHWTYNSISVTDNQDYTFSIYAKKSERTRLTIYPNDKAGVSFYAVYDIDAGTVVSTPAQMTTSIQDVGNGWYRCVGTWNVNTGSNAVFVRIGLVSSGTTISYQGDGTSGLFLWGQQLEAGAFPTSYIKTSGSTASRSADLATIDVDQFGYNQSEGTLFVEYAYYKDSTAVRAITLHDGTSLQRTIIGGPTYHPFLSGGVSIDNADVVIEEFNKIAVGLKANDIASVANGSSTVYTDTSATLSVNPTTLNIGSQYNNVVFGKNYIKSIKYYPKRLSNAKLQELTS